MIPVKVCTKCGIGKQLSEYHKNGQGGIRPDCRSCTKVCRENYKREHPAEYRTLVMASTILKRLKYCNWEGYEHLKCYKDNNVKCHLGETNAEVADVLTRHFGKEITELIASGLTPSVDRIDPRGDYELGNIRIIDSRENGAMGFRNANEPRKKPVQAIYPDGRVEWFESTNDAARRTGVGDVCGLIRRNGKSRKGHIRFRYAN